MSYSESDEDYENDTYDYDKYEEYCNTSKCKKYINNTSAVKPVAQKKQVKNISVVKEVKQHKCLEKQVVKQLDEKPLEVAVVDCWEDLI